MSLPKPLEFTVSLIDQITKPIAKITAQMNGLADNYQAATMQMASGGAGVAASAMAIHGALMPAIEIDRALGDIRGLGVTEDALLKVNETALDFSVTYGQAATEVLGHSEKLTNVLGKMPGHVLAASTEASATLAMVMKSDADTVGRFFKNLYGNYQDTATAMGRDKFIERITGMTAHAKQLFGTSMDDMEGMIDGMHSLPSTLGVAMEEQFAVLGMLGKQMGQGDAVTQYTNFLEGINGAQGKLGLNLTDESGNLLPMLDVLEKIKPLIAGMSGLQPRTFLDEAGLGDGSLAIINMIDNMDGLKTSIDSFKNIKGMEPATQMAASMTDQSQRLAQSWYAIRAALGAEILPAMNSFMSWMADGAKSVIWFTQTFPNLTRVLGYAALAVMGLIAAGGMLTMVMGAGKMAMTAYGAAAVAWTAINTALSGGLASLRAAVLAVNIVMYANPIGLIVAGIAAAIAAVGALVYYWDDLKAAMSEWGWLTSLGDMFATVWNGIKSIVTSHLQWVVDKLNMLPGVEIDLGFNEAEMPAIEQAQQVKSATETTAQIVPFAPMPRELELSSQQTATTAQVLPFPAPSVDPVQQQLQLTPQVAAMPELGNLSANADVTAQVLPFPAPSVDPVQQQLQLTPQIAAMPELGNLSANADVTAQVLPFPAPSVDPVQQQLQLTPQIAAMPELGNLSANADVTAQVLPFPAPSVDPVQQQLQLTPQVAAMPQLGNLSANADVTAQVLPFEVPRIATSVAKVGAVEPVQSRLPKGGVAAQMADAVQRTNHIGTINVYPKEVASFRVSDLELYAS